MKQFLILFLTPVAVLENWMKTPEEERKAVEEKMKNEWKAWIESKTKSFVDFPAGTGKTKSITTSGVADTKNNIMMYAKIEAESYEDACALFTNHPHLGIPEASIEIMQINQLTGMN